MYFPKCGHLTAPFIPQAHKSLNFNLLSLSKRECKTNYSVGSYFKDTLRAGQAKTDKAPKIGLPNRSQCELCSLIPCIVYFSLRSLQSRLPILRSSPPTIARS